METESYLVAPSIHACTHAHTHPFQYSNSLNQTLCACLVLDLEKPAWQGRVWVGRTPPWWRLWSNVASTTQNLQGWPCADSLQQIKTEASSMGPNRDSGSHGQLGLISHCLYPLLCAIKYHWVLKKRLLEVSWPLKWQGDFTSLL